MTTNRNGVVFLLSATNTPKEPPMVSLAKPVNLSKLPTDTDTWFGFRIREDGVTWTDGVEAVSPAEAKGRVLSCFPDAEVTVLGRDRSMTGVGNPIDFKR